MSNIGSIYGHYKNYNQALESHEQALKIFLEIDNKAYLPEEYTDIGAIQTKLKLFAKALKNLQTGLQIAREIGDKDTEIDGRAFRLSCSASKGMEKG